MEVIQAFLNNFTVKKDTDGKPITHTGGFAFPESGHVLKRNYLNFIN